MIENTPEIAAKLAARKAEWAANKGKPVATPTTLVCARCRRPGMWTEKVVEKRTRDEKEGPVAVPVVYAKSIPLSYQPTVIQTKDGPRTAEVLAHSRPCDEPRVRRVVLWDKKDEVSFWQRLTARKPTYQEAK